MATIAVAAIGAVIGDAVITGTVLGVSGAGIGWVVGSAVGSFLFAPEYNQEGPRISDMKINAGGYGVGIPIAIACPRVTGNVIWSSDLKETRNVQEVGKGGGSGEVVTYTYSVNCAVGVCEGPVGCIRRIWCNGKVIYDTSGTETIDDTVIPQQNITIYLGTESQAPDPLMQTVLGSDMVPGHRGLVYVVFEDLQLGSFGNRLPKFDFEVVTGGLVAMGVDQINYHAWRTTSWTSWQIGREAIDSANGWGAFWALSDGGNQFVVFEQDAGTGFPQGDKIRSVVSNDGGQNWTEGPWVYWNENYQYFPAALSPEGQISGYRDGQYYLATASDWAWQGTTRNILGSTDGLNWQIIGHYPTPNTNYFYSVRSLFYSERLGKWVGSHVYVNYNTPNAYVFMGTTLNNLAITKTFTNGGKTVYGGKVVEFAGKFWITHGAFSGTAGPIYLASSTDGVTWANEFVITNSEATPPTYVPFAHIVASPNKLMIIFGYGPDTTRPYTHQTLACQFTTDGINWSPVYPIDTDYDEYWLNDPIWTGAYFIVNSSFVYDATQNRIWWSRDGISWNQYRNEVAFEDGLFSLAANSGGGCAIATTPLSDVVVDLSARAGLSASDIDVSEIGGIGVKGYVISKQMTARAAIESLLAAYSVDAFESDGKIKFVPKSSGYGGPSVAETDLGVKTSSDSSENAVEVVRRQELELPNEVAIRYIDRDLNYDVNQQYARRIVGRSEGVITIDVPVVLDADEAVQLANSVLYRAWLQRDEYRFSTTQRYSALEPTDVLLIPYAGEARTVRLSKKEEYGLAINWTAVQEDLSLYTQTRTSAGGQATPPAILTRADTDLLVFETPVLRDSDDNLQFTVVAGGKTANTWPGATLFLVAKNGTPSSLNLGSLTNRAITGTLTANLAPVGDPIVDAFDATSVLSVSIPWGTLESRTADEVRAGYNCCVVQRADGSVEVLGFQTATLVSPGSYQLTNLLRRIRQNSSFSGASTGDRFAKLSPTASQLITVQRMDLGIQFEFAAPRVGQALDQADVVAATMTGMSKKPLSPVNVIGTRPSPPGNITITWDRRTRIGGSYATGENGPLGETREAYEVDIMSATSPKTVLRTLTSGTPSVTYTQANQIADFGSPVPTEIEVNVYQLSDFVGRGYPANALI